MSLSQALRFPEFDSSDYQAYKVSDFLERYVKPVLLEDECEYTEIGIRSWGKGIFYKEPSTKATIGNKRVFWLDSDLFIVNIVFAWEQAVAITTVSEVGKIASHRFPMFRVDADKANAKYLLYKFMTGRGKQLLELASPGGAGRNKTLGQKEFENLKVVLPSVKEQQKIAAFIVTIDRKIDQLKEKHRLLKEYQKGMMQQVFTQKVRFTDRDGNEFPEWTEVRLSNALEERKEKTTTENEYEVLTSSRGGLMKQSEYYVTGRITERSNIGYHVLPEGFLTYRSRSDDRLFFFNENALGVTGIISHYYPVFSMKNGQNKFFVYLARYYSNVFGKYAVGTSQVVLSFKALGEIKLPMPSADEQKKITQFLQSIDRKIEGVAKQIEQTERFKTGLLQQMFV
ncbi:restriction endonuclease subunit S [Vibrio sp. ED004]|uniref:restriction endonuclease subunit S n=1 Tax=Vibrio sp. ED004 TaxID=2785124 RepID=UPI002045FE1C|nr:restriction endonuclease subunit S [Vibrio sp. ED004]UPR58210.1 restriction endonuclease subunit S [Vibrio sp. ED004]